MPDEPGQINDCAQPAAENEDTPGHDHAQTTHSRRAVMGGATRLLVYSAPLIQLFRPSEALAASGVSSTS